VSRAFLSAAAALALAACGAQPGNDGSYGNARIVSLEHAIDSAEVTGRETYWKIRMGDGDGADAYRFSPPPRQGSVFTFMLVPDDPARSFTVDLVRPEDDSVIGGFTSGPEARYYAWEVDGDFYLRLRTAETGPEVLAWLGVRSLEGRPVGWTPRQAPAGSDARPDDYWASAENFEDRDLVVPLPLDDNN